MKRPRVWVLSGPNLDRLGRREPEIYGRTTLEEIHAELARVAALRGAAVTCLQTPHEGELVAALHRAEDDGALGVLLNPGAYAHTSIALLDAARAVTVPVVEVHLSNPEAREAFRRRSWVARACLAKVAGFGAASYRIALEALLDAKLGPPRPASRRRASARGGTRS